MTALNAPTVPCLPGCEYTVEVSAERIARDGGHGCVVHLGTTDGIADRPFEPTVVVRVMLTRWTDEDGNIEPARIELVREHSMDGFVGALPLESLAALAELSGKAARIAAGDPRAHLTRRREPDGQALHSGGTRTYRTYLDGRWVGWVGDGRRFTGHGYGGRKWWACWREDGDTAARWSSPLEFTSRAAAETALADRIAAGGVR